MYDPEEYDEEDIVQCIIEDEDGYFEYEGPEGDAPYDDEDSEVIDDE